VIEAARARTTPRQRARPASAAPEPPVDLPARELTWPVIEARTTLSDRIYAVVRGRILSGQLAPLTLVREQQVAQGMGVSRTPAREALSRLATEGFLERGPRRTFRVPAVAVEDLVDLYTVLRSLEVLAGELAFPRIHPRDLEGLEELNATFAEAVNAEDVAAAVELNDRFHHSLAALCGNPYLCRLLDDLRSQVHRLEVLEFSGMLLDPNRDGRRGLRRDKWVKQHAAILDAVRHGRHERARDLLLENRSLVFRAKVGHVRARQKKAADGA
jgi:DNA-binding GntR family transcriptional regulator